MLTTVTFAMILRDFWCRIIHGLAMSPRSIRKLDSTENAGFRRLVWYDVG
jgi:hypothetical protein